MRHKALKDLSYRACALFSGTLLHNKWYQMFGYLDFSVTQPFPTMNTFLNTFASTERSKSVEWPEMKKLKML
jgi:hypothetical protein